MAGKWRCWPSASFAPAGARCGAWRLVAGRDLSICENAQCFERATYDNVLQLTCTLAADVAKYGTWNPIAKRKLGEGAMSVVGVVVGSEKVVLVEGETGADGTVTLLKDETLDLERGERHRAYAIMHKRITDRFSHGNIERVVVKASSAGRYTIGAGALNAAELRGVVLSALPNGIEVKVPHKKTISRDFGSRKVDEYIGDETWWQDHFAGECRKGSREAAFLIIASEEEE